MVIEFVSRTTTFPTDWTLPRDSGAPYLFDAMHFPFPASPLEQSTIGLALPAGFTDAMQRLPTPINGMEVVYRNHYRFERYVMAPPPHPDEAQAVMEAAEASLKQAVASQMERWYGEHLPAITALYGEMDTMDARKASPAELLAQIDRVDGIHRKLWDIHFSIVITMMLSMQLFDELFADLFGGTEGDAHALVAGAASESVKAGFGLSDLAILARKLELDTLFRETPVEEIMPTLGETSRGREFLAMLADYLKDYGLRQDLFQITTPTWREDPSIALFNIRSYIMTGHDAREEHAAVARAAEDALRATRVRLAAYPEAVRAQFEAMLQFARQGSFLQEEHNFYLDQLGQARMRLFYVDVARRLVELGALAAVDDVFMLTVDEIKDILATGDPATRAEATATLVAQRRAEVEAAAAMTPPPFVGQAPSEPAGVPGNPVERGLLRFFGGPPQASEVPGQLKGNPGSRGVVSGPARVARTLADAKALQPGEILVAITTMPAWTPLFGVASGVVTETGGPLSHCAIVAREYGIPAVVGVHGATSTIATGQRITVDGNTGTVTIED